jgi:hypothetical protein
VTVRLRTTADKRYQKAKHAAAEIWKALLVAEKSFGKLNAPDLAAEVAEGTVYLNGMRIKKRFTPDFVYTPIDGTSLVTGQMARTIIAPRTGPSANQLLSGAVSKTGASEGHYCREVRTDSSVPFLCNRRFVESVDRRLPIQSPEHPTKAYSCGWSPRYTTK